MAARHRSITALIIAVSVAVGSLALVVFAGLFLALGGGASAAAGCNAPPAGGVLLGPGEGALVGATEYGGPGDPSSGTVGASGVNLLAQPDSYAELGGSTFATATMLGGLPYGTPLRITWGGRSVIAEKQDIGLGGGPIDGRPRVIDLWWELAGHLGIPYMDGEWSGTVRIERTPATGAGNVLGGTPAVTASAGAADSSGSGSPSGLACAEATVGPAGGLAVATVPGARAQLLPDGQALAPAGAPAAVKAIIAAGNEIVAKPYVYGGGHGLPLSEIAPSYDCSSSVAHLLWGGGLLGANEDMTSGMFESWGEPGPGRWVTLYASPEHVFMYVAGLRWDTWNAAGPGDGSAGIGWHPLIRSADGFVARHPVGL
ncbi:hypothetical protein [Conexibacter sp. DBS9H8]|uniref:hypothetical protein n=1 Tax=Conexibacter sp. DBS9H8 TaxID=2937801 RepID=UPI00200C6878|nr:hypothetical protein [Conexibacter sp. DBS9H8]